MSVMIFDLPRKVSVFYWIAEKELCRHLRGLKFFSTFAKNMSAKHHTSEHSYTH